MKPTIRSNAAKNLRQSGTSPRRARATAKRATRKASGRCGARIASITGSRALSSNAIMTIASIVASQSTVTITRDPGSGYAIQVSACVHASSDAANSAGQTIGTSTSEGQTANSRIANQRHAIAAVPKSIGQPASAEAVTGSVNIRAGYIDWRAAMSPESPKVNTARKYMKVAVIGTITTNAKLSPLSKVTRVPGPMTRSLIAARTNRYAASPIKPQRCRCRNSQAIAEAAERITHPFRGGAAAV